MLAGPAASRQTPESHKHLRFARSVATQRGGEPRRARYSDSAGGPLAWITTASICCCSLARGRWMTVDMTDLFVDLGPGSMPAAQITRLRPPDVSAHHMFDAICPLSCSNLVTRTKRPAG